MTRRLSRTYETTHADTQAKAEAIERQRLDIEEKTEKVREEIEELLPKINESRALKAPPAP